MLWLKLVLKWLLALLMVSAGTLHLVHPEIFMKIMPDYLPWHWELVILSGVFEIVLGALLVIPPTTRWAAWGLIALYIAVFPANVYLYQHQEILPLPPGSHLFRLVLQVPLILWAYWYTLPTTPRSPDGPNLSTSTSIS